MRPTSSRGPCRQPSWPTSELTSSRWSRPRATSTACAARAMCRARTTIRGSSTIAPSAAWPSTCAPRMGRPFSTASCATSTCSSPTRRWTRAPACASSYEDLAPLNERLIYASISAYGEAGEEASKPGFDSIALWARTGLMDLVRASPDVPPARSLPGMGDHPTGMSLFAAIMAGLYHRERTGRGTAVSTSLLANGLWMNAIPVQGILCGARTEVRPPREDAISALANLYRCRDGRWFMLTITGDERHWESFARGIGREDLVSDPRFEATEARRANAPVLTAILDEWFETRDWAAWSPILEKTGVAFGVVATLDDVPHDAQMRASGALVPIDDPRAGASHTVSSPLHIGGQEKVPPTLAPEIGEHTVEVLHAAGVAEAEIERLLRAKVIAQS